MSNELPDLPSALIRLALHDLKSAERSDLYSINMKIWHSADGRHESCLVCLAGAVMAFSLEAQHLEDMTPTDYCHEPIISNKLIALNDLRGGELRAALQKLVGCGAIEKGEMDRAVALLGHIIPIKEYRRDGERFKQDLADLATELEEIGL